MPIRSSRGEATGEEALGDAVSVMVATVGNFQGGTMRDGRQKRASFA
ncbi:hypothetical protein MEA186_16187 [Mesorhizobium amorphae CCNWGS0123]|uniref:Uncharacterized protein n=1 Tax=Mesorhizobium amorphae CCNWGS0123 TaxID=1082933 RepID=G6YBB3_9HYPH|nr:hypothetical protein MEA186_16187 [Mesorhizobium amorphae CCNWGS0123]